MITQCWPAWRSLYSDMGQISPWKMANKLWDLDGLKRQETCMGCVWGVRLDRRLVNEIPKVAIRNDNYKCSIPEANFEETCAVANGTVMICDEDQGTGAKKEFGTYTKLSLSSITEESCLNRAQSVEGQCVDICSKPTVGSSLSREIRIVVAESNTEEPWPIVTRRGGEDGSKYVGHGPVHLRPRVL